MRDVCGWCGFIPTGTPQECNGVPFCHGPGVPEPSCWQQASSGGRVVSVDFGERHDEG